MTVKELLSDPKRWTQHASARDAEGKNVAIADPSACKWCVSGALVKVYILPGEFPTPAYIEADRKLVAAVKKLYPRHAPWYSSVNDYLGYEAVMKLVEEAGV